MTWRARSTAPSAADLPATLAAPLLGTWEIVAPTGATETVTAREMLIAEGAYHFYDGSYWRNAHTTYPLANVFRCRRTS